MAGKCWKSLANLNQHLPAFAQKFREKRFTLNFSKASPTQTDKGQAKPFYFRAIFENSNTELQRSRKEKKRALKLILKTQTTRS